MPKIVSDILQKENGDVQWYSMEFELEHFGVLRGTLEELS